MLLIRSCARIVLALTLLVPLLGHAAGLAFHAQESGWPARQPVILGGGAVDQPPTGSPGHQQRADGQPEKGIHPDQLRRYGLMIAMGLLVLAGSAFFWTLRLRREVRLRRESEARIETAQKLLREVTDRIPGGMVYQYSRSRNGQFKVHFISDGVLELCGVTRQQVLTDYNALMVRIEVEDLEAVLAAHEQSAQTMKPYQVEYRVNLRDGQQEWLRGMATPRQGPDGSVIWNGFTMRITELKHVEIILRAAREHVVDLTRNLPVVVYQSALRRDGLVELLYNHTGYFELLGIRSETPLIHPDRIFAAVIPEDRDAVRRVLDRSIREMVPVACDFRVPDPAGGEPRWIRIESIPKPGSGDIVVVWNAYGHDITDRKRLESERDGAMKRAEAASRSKGEFLANMSHEIRTPMNAIIGLSHLALRTDPVPRIRDYLEKIQSSARSLLGVINDVLDFSKIEAGKLGVERVPFLLHEVFGNLSGMLGHRATEKGLELSFSVPPELPQRLIGDPLRLGQVLLNLTSNAIKFTERGKVDVAVRLLHRQDHQVQLEFSVTDTGIGISPEQQAGLFQSFVQADASTTRKYGGTGLGLAICRSLVELMEGDIRLRSAVGQGSCFSFTLPLGVAEEEEGLTVPQPPLHETTVPLPSAPKASCDWDQLQPLLLLLRRQLVGSDSAAMDTLDAIEAALGDYRSSELRQVKNLVESFSFEMALGRLPSLEAAIRAALEP